MAFTAILQKEDNSTRTKHRAYIRIHRLEYLYKFGIFRVQVHAYATAESGYKEKLAEDYYKEILEKSLLKTSNRYSLNQDTSEFIEDRTIPAEIPYNQPQFIMSDIYNIKVPGGFDIRDKDEVYTYIYDLLKGDSRFSEVEDILDDPSLEEIQEF